MANREISNQEINECIMRFARRAEHVDREKLVATFVSTGPLFTILSTRDHQIIYGRRGTGKTHALQYLAETVDQDGDISIYLDMRTVGSDGSLYADHSSRLAERATRLVLDVLGAFHDGILSAVLDNSEDFDLSRIGPLLDQLADAISHVRVEGRVSLQIRNETSAQVERRSHTSLTASPSVLTGGVSFSEDQSAALSASRSRSEEGRERVTIHFGTVGRALPPLLDSFHHKRFWLLLDEWSAIPLDLQPYLADLLRRALFPVSGISVKIAAIEHRSNFQLPLEGGDYVGIEVGADAQANLNLDDFMVFENDQTRSKTFFHDLLFKHFRASEGLHRAAGPQTAHEFVAKAFTQITAFEEFVRAVEGVPRDAINIAEIAAQRAFKNPISVPIIRSSARDWYQRDKARAVESSYATVELDYRRGYWAQAGSCLFAQGRKEA